MVSVLVVTTDRCRHLDSGAAQSDHDRRNGQGHGHPRGRDLSGRGQSGHLTHAAHRDDPPVFPAARHPVLQAYLVRFGEQGIPLNLAVSDFLCSYLRALCV